MPKYIIDDGVVDEAPLKVKLTLDDFGHANLKVNGTTIACLNDTGELILPYTKENNQPQGLRFRENGEIVTF